MDGINKFEFRSKLLESLNWDNESDVLHLESELLNKGLIRFDARHVLVFGTDKLFDEFGSERDGGL